MYLLTDLIKHDSTMQNWSQQVVMSLQQIIQYQYKYMKTLKVSSVDKTKSVKKILINRNRNIQSFSETSYLSCLNILKTKLAFSETSNNMRQKQIKNHQKNQRNHLRISKMAYEEYMNVNQSQPDNLSHQILEKIKRPKFFTNSYSLQNKKVDSKNSDNQFQSTFHSSKKDTNSKIQDIFQQQSEYFNTQTRRRVINRLEQEKESKRKQFLKNMKKIVSKQEQVQSSKLYFSLQSQIYEQFRNNLKKRQQNYKISFTVCSIYSDGRKKSSSQDTSTQKSNQQRQSNST